MDISIKYGKESIKFNLFEELVINENRINEEIKEQPSYYGFLLILKSKLERLKNDKQASVNKLFAELYVNYKSRIDSNTNRPYANDYVEARINKNKDYTKAIAQVNKAVENLAIVTACVEAFHQRSFLLQSLSANVRKEKSDFNQ